MVPRMGENGPGRAFALKKPVGHKLLALFYFVLLSKPKRSGMDAIFELAVISPTTNTAEIPE